MFGANAFGAIAFAVIAATTYPTPPVWTAPPILFRINGTDIPRVRFPALTIHDVIGAQPNTGQLTFDTIEPNIGAHLEIGLGSFGPPNLLFAGEIQRLEETYQSKPSAKLTEWPADLVDESFVLNKRRPLASYVNQSASLVAANLIATYATGFTSTHVQAGLPTVTINFDGSQPLLECLADLANAINPPARCKVDYSRDLHFFVPPESGVPPPDPLTWDNRPLNTPPIRFSVDLSQVRTRVYGKGHGEQVPVDVSAGETMLPVADAAFYTTTGGKVIAAITDNGAQTQVLTYSGISADVGHVGVARGIPVSPGGLGAAATAPAGNLQAGTYSYRMTCVNSNGDESELGASGATASIPTLATPGSSSGSMAGAGSMDAGTYFYAVAWKTANGETLTGTPGAATIPTISMPGDCSKTGTTGGSLAVGNYYYVITYVTASGETSNPLTGSAVILTSGQNAVNLTSIPTSIDSRVTGRRIYRTTVNSPNFGILAGYFLVATINDNTTTTLLDTKADGAGGTTPPTAAAGAAASRGQITASIPTSGDARVTGRVVYRTAVGGGSLLLLRTINDNTTTSVADNTPDSSLGGTSLAASTADNGRMSLVSIAAGPAGTVSRRIYRTLVGGSAYKFCLSIGDNVTSTATDNVADSSLGADAPTASRWRTLQGSTSLLVDDTAPFSEGQGWISIGNQILRFSGRTTTSGVGSLTGISPALIAAVPVGSPVIGYPWLKLTGGTPQILRAGSSVNIWVQRDDTAAQTALGLLERKPDGTPSDGIREYLIVDERRNESSLTQLCDADLATFSDPTIGVTYCCRDPKAKAGSVVHIALQSSPGVFSSAVFNPAVFNTGTDWGFAGDYLIQAVTITIDPAPSLLPRYQVQASSVKFTFTDLLQRVLLGA